MNRRLVIAAIFAVLLMGAAALSAAGTPAPAVTVTIPFEFRVGSSAMPAGQYRVQHGDIPDVVVFRQLHGKALAAVLSNSAGKEIDGSRAKLVFNRYGDSYFLRQVWIPGRVGAEFPPSKAEREQVRLGKQPEKTVLVAINQ